MYCQNSVFGQTYIHIDRHTHETTTVTLYAHARRGLMKALKCKPSAQFAYNYTINVSIKCGNIISHRSSVFEGRHNAIDLRRSAHRSSIFENRHIDLRRLKAETSHRQPNIAPTFRQFVTEYCPPRRFIIIIYIYLRFCAVYKYCIYNIRRRYTRPYIRYIRQRPHTALVMYYTPIYIAYMRQ